MCNGTCPPEAKISKETVGSRIILDDNSKWNDGSNCVNRKAQWIIYKNGQKVHEFDFETLDTLIDLGDGSTCKTINLANGIQDLTDYLENVLSIPCMVDDTIGVSRLVENCCNIISPSESEHCDFVVEEPTQVCSIPLIDNLGNIICPLDFGKHIFDLTDLGGDSQETFVDKYYLLNRLDDLTGKSWMFDESDCTVKTIYLLSEVCPTSIIVSLSSVCDLTLVDINGLPFGTINYPTSTFNLQPLGGNQNATFANESELLTELDNLTFSGWAYNVMTQNLYNPNVNNVACPASTSIVVTTNTTYTLRILGNSCPIIFAATVFNLVQFGGNAEEMFTDGNALASRLDILNPASQSWVYNENTCHLNVNSSVVPSVLDPIQTVSLLTYTISLLDGNNNAPCPIDYLNTEFDMTPYGGNSNEEFVNEDDLIARMEILNPVNNPTGNSYIFDPMNCSFSVESITSIVEDDLITTLFVEYSLPIEDGVGGAACPIDFTATKFDLSPFGGQPDEVFSNGSELSVRMDSLNSVTDNWDFDDILCRLVVESSTPPNSTGVIITAPLMTCDCTGIEVEYVGANFFPFAVDPVSLEVTNGSGSAAPSITSIPTMTTPLDAVIDWGDGNVITYAESITNNAGDVRFLPTTPSLHTYLNSGVYKAKLSFIGWNGLEYSTEFLVDTDDYVNSPTFALGGIFIDQSNCPNLGILNTVTATAGGSFIFIDKNLLLDGVNVYSDNTSPGGSINVTVNDFPVGVTKTFQLETNFTYKGSTYSLVSTRELKIKCQ